MNLNLNLGTITAGPPRGVISYDTLRDRTIDLVIEKGEGYKGHPGAYFKADGSPGCLLGELAAQDGATKSKLGHANQAGVGSLVALGYLIPADNRTQQALMMLQHLNDQGYTWFDAARAAFGFTFDELREEIEARKAVPVTFDAEGYVAWVESFEVGADKPVSTLPVHVPVFEHVLVA